MRVSFVWTYHFTPNNLLFLTLINLTLTSLKQEVRSSRVICRVTMLTKKSLLVLHQNIKYWYRDCEHLKMLNGNEESVTDDKLILNIQLCFSDILQN